MSHCDVWGKDYSSKDFLEDMEELFMKVFLSHCDGWVKDFSNKEYLKEHVRSVHEGVLPTALWCLGKDCRSRQNLNEHTLPNPNWSWISRNWKHFGNINNSSESELEFDGKSRKSESPTFRVGIRFNRIRIRSPNIHIQIHLKLPIQIYIQIHEKNWIHNPKSI